MASSSSFPSDRERLQIEHEFVQNLANPSYLHYLAQHRYFQDEQFMHFLKYLEYWRQPAYMKYLVFPQCLTVLNALITKNEFREALKYQNFRDYFHSQQVVAWSLGKWPSKFDIERGEEREIQNVEDKDESGDRVMDIIDVEES